MVPPPTRTSSIGIQNEESHHADFTALKKPMGIPTNIKIFPLEFHGYPKEIEGFQLKNEGFLGKSNGLLSNISGLPSNISRFLLKN